MYAILLNLKCYENNVNINYIIYLWQNEIPITSHVLTIIHVYY